MMRKFFLIAALLLSGLTSPAQTAREFTLPLTDDGAARLTSNGALAGSTLRINCAFRNIAEVTGLPLKELVKSTSLTAARSLGLEKVGMIRTGYCADMVLLDADFSVAATIVDGEVRYRKNAGIFA